MRAAVFHAPHQPLTIEDVEIEKPKRREILLRTSPLRPGRWLSFLVVSVCLALSAFYELVEWWVAVGSGTAADAFLATQGDVWDTQWDMFMALCGAIVAQVLLARWHDRQLRQFMRG